MSSFLIIGPHPDDQELGMGGAIATLVKQGHTVHLVDMTNGEPTPLGSPEIRARESAEAARLLGVERTALDFKNREVTYSIEARHKLAAVYRKHRPNVIFIPYGTDAHPDHVATTRIAEDARFDAKLSKTNIPGDPWHPKRIIYYFCTHLRLNINPTFCLDVTESMPQKIAAMNAYHSQLVAPGAGVIEMVRNLNAYFGGRIGTAYAEPFFSHEVIGFSGLDQLV